MRIGRWSELNIYRVCQEHEVMREANETSGELGSALGGTLVGVSHLRISGSDQLIRVCHSSSSSIGRSGIPRRMPNIKITNEKAVLCSQKMFY